MKNPPHADRDAEGFVFLERATGIEPASRAWKAVTFHGSLLQKHDPELALYQHQFKAVRSFGKKFGKTEIMILHFRSPSIEMAGALATNKRERSSESIGAGDGNRTRVVSLEGSNSTIELRPQYNSSKYTATLDESFSES